MGYEKLYWDERYKSGGNSGYGSYGDQLAQKLAWLKPLDFNSVTEVGCGDFNFGMHILLDHDVPYIGLDISPVIIERNKELYPHDFRVFDGTIPHGELLLCVDVLFHIIEDEDVEIMLDRLERAWTKYLVISAYERDEEFHNHVRIRKFDYKRFGEPILREVIEEDGQLYFYIFKKDDRPITSERVSHYQRPDISPRAPGEYQPIPVWRNTAPHSLRQSVS